MTERTNEKRISRRAMLKASGLALSTVAVGPLFSTSSVTPQQASIRHATNVDRPFTIGVLLPQSQIYPHLGSSLLAGMQLYLAQIGNHIDGRPIALVPGAYGISVSRAHALAKTFVRDDRVDVVTGALSRNGSVELGAVLHEHHTPLVVSDVGANILRQKREHPLIFRNSLSYWQSNWALGDWAARTLGRTAFVASSFYESGYDTMYAFQHGFASAGGSIAATHVSHMPGQRDNQWIPLLRKIAAERPDLVYATYSSTRATEFVHAYSRSPLANHIPLVGAGFLVDEHILSTQGDAAHGITSVMPWSPTLNTIQNRAFISAYQAHAGVEPDAFAMLGYDTARMILGAAQAAKGNREQLIEALDATAFASPRGAVTMDTTTRTVESPLYLREVRAQDGCVINNVMGQLASPLLNDVAEIRTSMKTGWLNGYLSA